MKLKLGILILSFVSTNVCAEVHNRCFGGFDPVPITVINKKTKKECKKNIRSTPYGFEVPGQATIKTSKNYYKEYESITVCYHHFPEHSTGWVSITEANRRPIHNEWIKAKGSSGKMIFKGLPMGNYKAYGYAVWKRDKKRCTNTVYFKVR